MLPAPNLEIPSKVKMKDYSSLEHGLETQRLSHGNQIARQADNDLQQRIEIRHSPNPIWSKIHFQHQLNSAPKYTYNIANPASNAAPAIPPFTIRPLAALVLLAVEEEVVELEPLPDPEPDPAEEVGTTTSVV